MTGEQARNIFNAVKGMSRPTQDLFSIAATEEEHGIEVADEVLVPLIEEYVAKKQALDDSLTTRGLL